MPALPTLNGVPGLVFRANPKKRLKYHNRYNHYGCKPHTNAVAPNPLPSLEISRKLMKNIVF